MKKIQELRSMSDGQFKSRLNEIEVRLQWERGCNMAGKPSFDIHKLRKEKARILTLLRERQVKKDE